MKKITVVLLLVAGLASVFSQNSVAGDWVSPDSDYQRQVTIIQNRYRDSLNELVNSFLDGEAAAENSINAPETVANWFNNYLQSFPMDLPEHVRKYCINIIFQDKENWIKIAKRRRFQVAQKLLDMTDIEKNWDQLFNVKCFERNIIIPAPDGFSVYLNPIPFKEENCLIEFQPVTPISFSIFGNRDRNARLYKQFTNDDSHDSIRDLNNLKHKVISSSDSSEGIVYESAFSNNKVVTKPIFEEDINFFCYGEERFSKSKVAELEDSSNFTAICILLSNGYIFRLTVEVKEKLSKADEAWATAVLTSWRDAILQANQ